MTFANWTLLLWSGRRWAGSLITAVLNRSSTSAWCLPLKWKEHGKKTSWLQRGNRVYNLSAGSYWGSVFPLRVCKHFSHVKIFNSGNAESGEVTHLLRDTGTQWHCLDLDLNLNLNPRWVLLERSALGQQCLAPVKGFRTSTSYTTPAHDRRYTWKIQQSDFTHCDPDQAGTKDAVNVWSLAQARYNLQAVCSL